MANNIDGPMNISSTRNSSRLWTVPIQSNTSESNYFATTRRYRTCCGCHVRTFAFIIGLLELIALIAAVIATAVAYVLLWQNDHELKMLPLDHHASLSMFGSLISFLIGLIVVGLLFFGLAKERPSFLIPHMIIQFVAVLGCLAAVVVFVYVAAVAAETGATKIIKNIGKNQTDENGKIQKSDHIDRKTWPNLGSGKMFIYSIIISSLCLFASILEIYFLIAVYRTYSYFCTKREELKKQAGPVKLWSTGSSFRGGDDSVIAARIWTDSEL